MKKLIIASTILASAFATKVSAQETELYTAKLKESVVPIEVVTKVKTDFPDNEVIEYRSLPLEIVGYDWVVNQNQNMDLNMKYSSYAVEMMGKDGKVSAMYDDKGKLISYRSKLMNVALPTQIDKNIVENYPGWVVAKDSETITINRKDESETYYKVEIKKGKEKMHLLYDGSYNLDKASKI